MNPQIIQTLNNNLVAALNSLEEEIKKVKSLMTWENLTVFGRKLAKEKKVKRDDILQSIYETRYQKTPRSS